MVLLYSMMKGVDLTERDGGAMRLVVALAGGLLGVTAGKRHRLREPVTVHRWLEKLQRGLGVPLRGEQKGAGLAGRIHRPLEIPPRALDLARRLVQPSAEPHRALAGVERFLMLYRW